MFKAIIFYLFALISVGANAQDTDTPNIDFKSMQKSNWTEQERNNALIIKDFVQNLMNNHNFEYVLARYNNSEYKQHNRNLPDKMAGLVDFLKDFVTDYPEYSYDVKRILVDGDFVTFHSHATLYKEDRGNDKKGMNIMDTWRLEDGRIVEHWDAIQALDGFMRFYSLISGGTIRNDNGVF